MILKNAFFFKLKLCNNYFKKKRKTTQTNFLNFSHLTINNLEKLKNNYSKKKKRFQNEPKHLTVQIKPVQVYSKDVNWKI